MTYFFCIYKDRFSHSVVSFKLVMLNKTRGAKLFSVTCLSETIATPS
jgi:hypothetical protein